MTGRYARGFAIGLWGLGLGYALTLVDFRLWTIPVLAAAWGVYYSTRPITPRAVGLQLATIWVGATILLLTAWSNPGQSTVQLMGFGVFLAVWYLALWMIPVAIVLTFFRDGQSGTRHRKDGPPTQGNANAGEGPSTAARSDLAPAPLRDR